MRLSSMDGRTEAEQNGSCEVEQTNPERLPLLDAFVEERIGDRQRWLV